jgi:hypothetical protein
MLHLALLITIFGVIFAKLKLDRVMVFFYKSIVYNN